MIAASNNFILPDFGIGTKYLCIEKKVKDMSFVHLHVHTEYSTDGLSNIRCLFEKAAKLGMPGLAITDHGTIAGVPEFFSLAEDFPTVKPIAGCEFWLGTYHLILLAKNMTGYRNLVKLSSISHCEGMAKGKPRISHEQLAQHHEGLICTSACIGGEIAQKILADDSDGAVAAAWWYKNLFGKDFYLEVALHRNFNAPKLSIKDNRIVYRKQNQKLLSMQKKVYECVLEIGRELGIKVVATNDVHFVDREDGIAHDALLCLRYKSKIDDENRLRFSHLEYLKSEKEMLRLFPEHPEVLSNTMEILDKVERYSIWKEPALPASGQEASAKLITTAWNGASARFGKVEDAVSERLSGELSVICKAGFAGYFLMMKDLVDWVRTNGWVVGPGRGNSPGSLVCYCLRITDVDPLKHGLLFERFWGNGDLSKIKIDLDLEPEAKEHIEEYLKETYGRDSVGGIAVYGRYSETSAFRAAEKLMGKGDEAFDVAARLVGVVNEYETIHACGWLISSNLKSAVPTQIQAGTWKGEHTLNSLYESQWAQKAGVLQINVLQLKELKTIKDTFVDTSEIPLDDQPTLELFARGDTEGIFQFSSEGMREWLQVMKPKSFEDLVALETMYRPGLLERIPDYIAGKPVLIYQEQELLQTGSFSRNTFPKAHALCYTLIAYWMAWIKAHYPEEFQKVICNQ